MYKFLGYSNVMELISGKRENDYVLSCHYSSGNFYIDNLNDKLSKLLGKSPDSLLGMKINNILNSDVNSRLCEIEHEHEITKLSSVSGFGVINSCNNDVKLECKVFPVVPSENGNRYELLMRDASLFKKLEQFRSEKHPNTKYSNDSEICLICEQDTKSEIKILYDFASAYEAQISFVIITAQSTNTQKCIRRIGDSITNNVRSTDFVGYLGNDSIIICLLDCKSGFVHVAANRLHDIAISQGESYGHSVTINTKYCTISKFDNYQDMITEINRVVMRDTRNSGVSSI